MIYFIIYYLISVFILFPLIYKMMIMVDLKLGNELSSSEIAWAFSFFWPICFLLVLFAFIYTFFIKSIVHKYTKFAEKFLKIK